MCFLLEMSISLQNKRLHINDWKTVCYLFVRVLTICMSNVLKLAVLCVNKGYFIILIMGAFLST